MIPPELPTNPGGSMTRARWMVPVALMVSLIVAFIDRNNMGLALPQMKAEFGWTDEELGANGTLFAGAFFITYGISNIIFSPLAARFGPRRSLMTIVILFSIFTALGSPAASLGMGAFAATRVLLGISEGVHFPMMSTVTKRWFPMHERSRANGIWVSGGTIATMLAPFLLVTIIDLTSWRTMLVVCGALGVSVTLPFLYFFVFDSPRQSPHVSAAEIAYIEAGIERVTPVGDGDWSFLRSPDYYLATVAGALNNICVYGITVWLPTYFTEAKGIDFSDLKWVASLPFVSGAFGIAAFSYLGDRTSRRVLTSGFGFATASLFVFLATRAPTTAMVVGALSIGTFAQMSYIPQEWAIIQRILPERLIGKGVGVYNGTTMLLGGVPGAMLPGLIIAKTGNYDAAMLAIVGAAAGGAVAMFLLSRRMKY